MAVLMCISKVSFRFPNIGSLWGEYLEIWEGGRIGSGSDQTAGFVTRDDKYFVYFITLEE